MKSSKIQSFWTGFILVMLLLLGGAGYFFATSLSAFSNSKGSFDKLKADRGKLEKAKIFPSEKNVSEFTAKLDRYETEVNNLHGLLKAFQKPLVQIPPTQFPQDLKKKLEEFRAYSTQMKVTLPKDFFLGMDEYVTTVPVPGASGILSYELDAIDRLLHIVIDNGADAIYTLNRERTAVESGKTTAPDGTSIDPETSGRVAKYPVTFQFRTTNRGFQEFLNEVSNDQTYFYIVRVLRVDSEIGKGTEPKMGPPKLDDQANVWTDKDGNVITDIKTDASGQTIIPENAVLQDAAPILGNTKIRVTAVVDLCRFPEVAN